MNLTKTWLAGLTGILLSMAAIINCDSAQAQSEWQDSASSAGVTSGDWQRTTKTPQPTQWRPARQTLSSDGQYAAQAQTVGDYRKEVAADQGVQARQKPTQLKRAASQYPDSNPRRTAGVDQSMRRTSYDGNAAFGVKAATGGRETVVPSRQRVARVSNEEVVEPGATRFEPVATQGAFAGGDGCASCAGGECDGCGECDACCGPACGECCDGWEVFDGCCGPWLRGLSVFVGGDAFKSSIDYGQNGNFGLNEGLNLARPLGDPWGCGYQIGANFVQSDFSGSPLLTVDDQYNLHSAYRKQYFVTAGLFRRADPCGGFQWGVAYDYLHDVYYETADLQQLRSETSFVFDGCYEFGYYGAYGVGTDRTIDGKLDPTDMFALFLRKKFENGGDGRIWAGATGYGDGLLGADLWVPLGKGFALENRINYMIPKEGRGDTAQTREAWGFVIQLVWYPGQNARCQQQDPYRPIFNVADNSLFMVDRLTNH